MRVLVPANDRFEFEGHDMRATRLNDQADQHRHRTKNQGAEIKNFFHRVSRSCWGIVSGLV
jgi:hypothetical protein